jgi:hypothetical protein
MADEAKTAVKINLRNEQTYSHVNQLITKKQTNKLCGP